MKHFTSKLNGRTWRKPTLHAASLIKMMAVPLLGMAASICATTSAFAQQVTADGQSSSDVVCVGTSVAIQVSGDSCGYPFPAASVNGTDVYLTPGSGDTWNGTFTASTPGTFTVLVSDSDCPTMAFNSVTLTVVQLNGILLNSEPAGSAWSEQVSDTNGYKNNIALESGSDGDFVTFGLNMIPNTAAAATMITWCGDVSSSSDNLTATLQANNAAGPIKVTAKSQCSDRPTDPLISWIMWGDITYNFNGALASGDRLAYTNSWPTLDNTDWPVSWAC